ncbi:MAG: 2,3-bisphosphoglycerate-independent phosphoglycerate mutase [Candidatus Gracilibacteria bacterium]|nr:2,3-bisphosphoglycerate-independent phosphoglycerate mutase [Candidatus Gracilibacteria bacterium]
MTKRIGLIILDGFGINEKIENNAIKKANTPTFDKLFASDHSSLEASEEYVGLPKGQMGNSEVGHMAIGSGRLLKQDLVEINDLFKDKLFENIEEFKNGIIHAEKYNSKIHLLTLFGSGGVHSYIDHLYGIISIIPKNIKVCLHLFSDGRDLARDSMLAEFEEFLKYVNNFSNVEITSISGRFYAMDRDNNWDRTKKTYDVMVNCENKTNLSPIDFIKNNYKNEIYDEFFEATNFSGNKIENNDVIFHLNFRSDRGIQLAKAFDNVEIGFDRKNIQNIYLCTMTKYYKDYNKNVFIKAREVNNTLGEVLSKNNMTQLHLAETEKFAHVTKFFNGGKQIVYPGEKDILIPSPKVTTYDQKPEMSAYEVYNTYRDSLDDFDFTVINFANGDMVGHTGNMQAAIRTVETLDDIVGKLIELSKDNNIDLYITADHGNCEEMFDEKGEMITSHTTNRVPFWYIHEGINTQLKEKIGTLADIAPTILDNFGIDIPNEMSGKVMSK